VCVTADRGRVTDFSTQYTQSAVCKTSVIRYDAIEEFNVDSKAKNSALSSTRSQK